MRKIVVAVTGASGAIYAQLLIQKLKKVQDQWDELAIIFSDNARTVWDTELENQDYLNGMIQIYNGQDYYLLQEIQEIKDY